MNFKQKASLAVVAIATVSTNVFATVAPTVTIPTPDYTTFTGVVGLALGVGLIVMLARKAKGFIR